MPDDLDLIDGSEAEVERGLESLARLILLLSKAPGLTDMAPSKVLHLRRPRFVAISDSYVRNRLGVRDTAMREALETPSFYAARMLAVRRSFRELALKNSSALQQLKLHFDQVGSVVPTELGYKGCRIPVSSSKVRILDILLWTEEAIKGSTPHENWSPWYQREVGSR